MSTYRSCHYHLFGGYHQDYTRQISQLVFQGTTIRVTLNRILEYLYQLYIRSLSLLIYFVLYAGFSFVRGGQTATQVSSLLIYSPKFFLS